MDSEGFGRLGSASVTLPRAERPGRRQTLICFSHLRWDFVFQRPQHLMSRFARDRHVITGKSLHGMNSLIIQSVHSHDVARSA